MSFIGGKMKTIEVVEEYTSKIVQHLFIVYGVSTIRELIGAQAQHVEELERTILELRSDISIALRNQNEQR